MMVSAFARSGTALEEPRYVAAAQSTMRFIESHLLDTKTNRLKRSWISGTTSGDAFLDDYTSLVAAYIDLYQADFNVTWLDRAMKLQEKQDEIFWSASGGGYFDTPPNAALLTRTRSAYDGAEPAPNSAAAMNLIRLAHITGRDDWQKKADRLFAAFGPKFTAHPESLPAMASALDFALSPARHILIAGDPNSADTKALLHLVRERYLPNAPCSCWPTWWHGPAATRKMAVPFVGRSTPHQGTSHRLHL